MTWFRQFFSHRPYRAAWGGALAFSVVIVMVLQINSTSEQPGEPPAAERYIAGDGMQDIQTDHPKESARQIEQRLRQLGVAVDLRHEAGGMVTLHADISTMPADQRAQFFRDFDIQPMAGPTLKLTFIQAQAQGRVR